ncbi:TonB-dependent receptor family protein [Celeribacter persicus]|uniref:Iron complex outermembrane receptor protein n=1 Tax=Celeribacter persicus TaxID=1651082 RepID=A0A2T5H9S1_9RHOB|nr:TonB-dependent receptor [Celeribacter persicus]PTQ68319.1 iron complex outermembrane receptor protein [Celeribacter persicus]
MTYTRFFLSSVAAAALMTPVLSSVAVAQSASPGAVIELEPIVIKGKDALSTAELLEEKMQNVPLAADVVGREDYATAPSPTLAEALKFSPGVVVQEFFGGHDQPRLQIRGSGLQQNPTERGIIVLQDGMPINRADGTFVVGLAAPSQAEAIEVWRGASANRLGASVMGGALNFISSTADTRPGSTLSFGAGSFDSYSAKGSHAIDYGNLSALFRFDLSTSDGERDYNGSDRRIYGGNLSYDWGNGVVTQVFLSHAKLDFDVPGPLSLEDLNSDYTVINQNPMLGAANGNGTGIGPNVVRDQPGRETEQTLIGSRTTFENGAHRYDVGVSYSQTDDEFTFPIAHGVRVTDGWDTNLMARYAYVPDAYELPLVELTANYAYGEADRDYYENSGGNRGAQFGQNEFEASTLSVYAGANVPIGINWLLTPSLSYTRATRDNEDLWGNGSDFENTYDGWSPSLSLRWKPNGDQTAWVSVARSFDAPTSDDLISPVGGNVNTSPTTVQAADLDAQIADTIEIGWRGRIGAFGWDAVAYHAEIENEFLLLNTSSGVPYTTNAGETVHNGLELGLSGEFSPVLRGRLAYTWQDFHFDNDATRGDNQLAGAPEHLLTAGLEWDVMEDLTLSGTVTWRDKMPVDNMNTTWADDAVLLDLGARWRVSDMVELVAEVTNVTDETYASAVVANDILSYANQAVFIPGSGRAVFIGTNFSF